MRQDVARSVNSCLVMLYWNVGRRMRQEVLGEKRAEYGADIVATVSRQLGWSHFVEIMPLKNELPREFYADMGRVEQRKVRLTLQRIF